MLRSTLRNTPCVAREPTAPAALARSSTLARGNAFLHNHVHEGVTPIPARTH